MLDKTNIILLIDAPALAACIAAEAEDQEVLMTNQEEPVRWVLPDVACASG
jgi:hypothetical protein